MPDHMASGAEGPHACQARRTLTALDHGQCRKNTVTSRVGWVLNPKETATPRLPAPPPREAQYRSALWFASQVSSRPSAVTICTDSITSQVRPYFLETTPIPPPQREPAHPDRGAGPGGDADPARGEPVVDVDQLGPRPDGRPSRGVAHLAHPGDVEDQAGPGGPARVGVAA
ncbi:hypothetical protein GCM10018952_36770 [Streptosporangium vulgare]